MPSSWAVVLTVMVGISPAPADDKAGVQFFEQKIRPVLVEHCYSCHSTAAQSNKKLKGGLLLDTREGVLRGGDTGPAVVPSDAKKSLLLTAIAYTDADMQMPPKKRLPDSVVADFKRWIELGAPDPRETGAVTAPTAAIDFNKAREHWAWQPLKKPALPQVSAKNQALVRTPIDAFLLAKMEQAGVQPAPLADPRTLIRRVYLDLTGLPPTPEEVEAFVKGQGPGVKGQEEEARHEGTQAERRGGIESETRNPKPETRSSAPYTLNPTPYTLLIDRLLASPHYGERFGRHWLDVARYAETQGYERDENKPFAWRYRDYVIDAFNRDMPFTRFVQEQIAGDELEDSTTSSQIATGFLRVGTYDTIAADGKAAKYDNLDDTLGVTMSAFLGLTIQCARCHDHKFEPLTQQDYYRLLCVFEPLPEPRNAVPVGGEAEQAEYAKKLAAWEESVAQDQSALDQLRIDALESADLKVMAEKKIKLDAKRREEALTAYRTIPSKRDQRQKDLTSLEGGKRWDEVVRAVGTADEVKQLDKLYNELKRRDDKDKPVPMLAFAAGEGKPQAAKKGKPQPVPPPAAASAKAGAWPTTKLMIRGEVHKPGDDVRMGVPQLFASHETPELQPTGFSSGRRLWLAKWITTQAQPLLARTIVNRVWQQHFGRGFVANANELGISGGTPSHPQLLDWLAADFVEHGWQLKRLHKMIAMSSMYQLAAQHADPDKDIEAAIYSRWKSRRLEAEAIRDSVLFVSGRLNLKMGGPSIHPPFENKIVGDSAGAGWEKSDESESVRRSVYIYVKRAIPLPDLEILNAPDSSVSMPKRQVATTSVQALLLLNGRLATEQAAVLAERLVKEAGSEPAAQIRRLWLLTLSREPRQEELAAAMDYLKQHPRAGKSEKTGVSAAMVSLCQVVMNTNEFVYLN